MSQHGRTRVAGYVEDEPVRRVGFLTVETALVLGLVLLIVLGSVLVSVALPSKRENSTVVGDKKVRITTVGKGGVQPGPIQPRNIPVVVPTPVAVAAAPTKTPKPRKTVSPLGPTATPTPKPTNSSGGVLPGGDNTGGGGKDCTVLLLCKPGQTPAPTPAQTSAPSPAPAASTPAQPPALESPLPQ